VVQAISGIRAARGSALDSAAYAKCIFRRFGRVIMRLPPVCRFVRALLS
jgi:hypothetical protein